MTLHVDPLGPGVGENGWVRFRGWGGRSTINTMMTDSDRGNGS